MANTKPVGVAYSDPALVSGTTIDGATITGSTLTGATVNNLSTAELAVLDGVTPGTGAASKALVLNAAGGAVAPGALTMFGAATYTTQVSALTTIGAAVLSTAQLSNLTTTQLSNLCTSMDGVIAALKKVGITA